MRLGDLGERIHSIGIAVAAVNGHDVVGLRKVLTEDADRPRVIISHTVKGKGVPFAENQVAWHIGYLTKELYQEAMESLSYVRDESQERQNLVDARHAPSTRSGSF